jgi:solute carrier family 25 (mitochondrial carnitine/acylcarnitine transporter), member 20/29
MIDFIVGGIIGTTQTLLGHPLDTIKVRIQNKQNWKNMKLRNYYRGSLYPLSGSLIYNTLVFPTYDRTFKYTNSSTISGLLSGIVVSPLVYLFDIGKIRRQSGSSLKISDFYKTRGMYSNILRESLANSAYFGGYFYCKKELEFSTLLSGGIAGLLNWTLTYPIDVIRTRQMTYNISIKEAINQKHLWRGFTPCAIRAIIVNSASFYVYEFCKDNIY